MKKKGQVISIVAFFAIVIAVFFVAFIVLKMANSILDPFETAINQTSESAGTEVGLIHTSMVKWWDYVVLMLFFLNVIILFVTSFMIDIHPAFLILYIFAVAFLFIFGFNVLIPLQDVMDKFGLEVSQMPMTEWIINNFGIVLLGVVVLSGIVMYAKFRMQGMGGAY